MPSYWLHFDSPNYLWLFTLMPILWWISRRSYSGLRGVQWAMAVTVRSLVYMLVVLALADAQFVRTNNRLTVIYLLDQSHSIPADQRDAMNDFVNKSIAAHRATESNDRAGVMVFGRKPELEIPPLDMFPVLGRIQSMIDPEFSDLAAALARARSVFQGDSAGRIVLVTDGNENLGDALAEARVLADAGIGIDVVPVHLSPRVEVAVEKLTVPVTVRDEEPFEMRMVMNVDAPASSPFANRPLSGSIRIVRKGFGREERIAEQDVELAAGKTVLNVSEQLDRPGFYTYEAHFSPNDPSNDGTARNNMATAHTQVIGSGQVLFIENVEDPGRHDSLIDMLRRAGIEVELANTSSLFNSLAELQRFDCVILADVPRAVGLDDDVISFSDAQMRMLVQNTESLGCGLVVIGGPNSLGAGGWAGSELEKALPVDCQIKDARVVPIGALGLVIDRSGSMSGEKIQLSKAAAIAAVRSLGKRDMVSVVAFDSTAVPVCRLQRIDDGARIASSIQRLSAGGGTDMYPAFDQVISDLERAEASVKHIIVLTDGQTPDRPFDALLRRAQAANITVSAVAIGQDAQIPLLTKIAGAGGGRFYAVRSPQAVPRIFMREARRVSRPLVRDLEPPQTPIVDSQHPIIDGLASGFPPVRGFVMTTVKQSALVEVMLRSPVPSNAENNALLATWNYGLGKVVVFTSDVGTRWTNEWTTWDGYDAFYTKMVRWAMRPGGDSRNYTLSTGTEDGMTTVVIDALDDRDNFINQSTGMTATLVGPDSTTMPLMIDQVAPGRYVGRFESRLAGTYFIAVSPAGGSMLRTGVSVGYSREYRDLETNIRLLESIASMEPRGGKPGQLVGGGASVDLGKETERLATVESNPFRHDLPRASAIESIWPWLVMLAACVFVGDVGIRHVQIELAAIATTVASAASRWRGREPASAPIETLTRLQSRKQSMRSEATTQRWEPKEDTNPRQDVATEWNGPPAVAPPRETENHPTSDEEVARDSYTARLLKAKRDATKRD